MVEFGQNAVGFTTKIAVIHLHMIEDLGAPGSLSVEVFRWRRTTGVHTYLGTLTWTGGALGNFGTVALVPATTEMLASDYMQAQLRSFTAGGGGNGMTMDMHFTLP